MRNRRWPELCTIPEFSATLNVILLKRNVCASELIEISTHQNFATWLPGGAILQGWARSAYGDTAEGISWIEHGISDYRATGRILDTPSFLALKAEALHLADRSSEALEAIEEAEALAERSGRRDWCAEIHRLRGMFLTAMGAEETQIEVRSAKPSESQKSRSRFHWGHAQKQTQNTAAKKRLRQKGVDCGYLFGKTPKKGNKEI
jgi:predicted ATPase